MTLKATGGGCWLQERCQRARDVPVTELFAPHVLCPPSTLGCQDCARQELARMTTAAT